MGVLACGLTLGGRLLSGLFSALLLALVVGFTYLLPVVGFSFSAA